MTRPHILVLLAVTLLLASACSTDTREVMIHDEGPRDPPAGSLPPVVSGAGWEGVIFDADAGRQVRWLRGGEAPRTWEPTLDDIRTMEAGLRAALLRAQADPSLVDPLAGTMDSRRDFLASELLHVIDHLPHYRRQYVGLIQDDGRRTLFINAFPGPDWPEGASFDCPRWRQELVCVSDGGFWFWEAEYDPATGELVVFDSHGYA